MAFKTQTLSNLNTNSLLAATASVDITAQSEITWTVQDRSGAHTDHETTLQVSLDNTNWENTDSVIHGTNGIRSKKDLPGYVRFCTTIVEGAASTVNIIINAK